MRQNMTTIVKYAADPFFTTAHGKYDSAVEKEKLEKFTLWVFIRFSQKAVLSYSSHKSHDH